MRNAAPRAHNVTFRERPHITDVELNALFEQAWPAFRPRAFDRVLQHSLTYVVAYHEATVVGFVNVAWDGYSHAFLLDPTVHPAYQRRGIGSALVQQGIDAAKERGVEWMHVDFEARLFSFYEKLGFHSTTAGLLRLHDSDEC